MNFGSNNSWYMMYFDQGLNDNFHITVQAQPTTTYTTEVFKYNSKMNAIKINNVIMKTWSCENNAPCPTPTIAGAVSWGTNTNSGFTVNGYLFNLQLKRPSDTNYQYFDSVANQSKCNENPSDLGYEKVTNQIIVDATTKHNCSIKSDSWLYRGGLGG